MNPPNKQAPISLEEGWEKIKRDGILPFIELIESGQSEFFKAKEFVKLYDLVFKMCIQRDPHNCSPQLYKKYTESIRNYLQQNVRPALKAAQQEYETAFLRAWVQKWANQKLIIKGFGRVFMYLDRFFTKGSPDSKTPADVLSLEQQGFKFCHEEVFSTFSAHARTCILNAINRERDNEEQDRHLLNQAVNVFVEMGFKYSEQKLAVYSQELENHIVAQAGEFYKRKARSWLEGDSCPAYVEKVEACIDSEERRVDGYLNEHTKKLLLRECYIHLLKDVQIEMLTKQTGIDNMLELNRVDDLARLYRLFHNYVEDLPPIAALFQDYIKRMGIELVDRESAAEQKNPEASHSLVESLINFHDRFNVIVRDCFKGSQVFQKSLKAAFEAFINKDERVSKLLAKFVHELLQKHSKIAVKDMNSTLDNVVFLYGYITEKDLFELDYQGYLAQRLLMGLCESEHTEKSMIAKLKTESGYQWTNRLEGMFKDVAMSQDGMEQFKKFFNTEEKLGLDLNVIVCTTGYWPSGPFIQTKIPDELAAACEKYKRFYLNKHSGHRLEWRMELGQAEVQVFFTKTAKHVLICTTYQMLILTAFNHANPISFKDILEFSGIPEKDIGNHLLSMVHPNVKILLKKPGGKDMLHTDQFIINPKYSNKLIKIQVPLLSLVKDSNTGGDDPEKKRLELQRSHQIDASIVRIMKTRKDLRHNDLVIEVVNQLNARFKAEPRKINQRIGALIEQEYLERDKDERNLYHYLA